MYQAENPAVVLGMFETGLGVSRSLGRKGVRVIGVDFKEDVGFRSKYVTQHMCPHPLKEMDDFIENLIALANRFRQKATLFMTADEFVLAVSRRRRTLSDRYLLNLPPADVVESIMDKKELYENAKAVGVLTPKTFFPRSFAELKELQGEIQYPVFMKGCYGFAWRSKFGARKGFVVNNEKELVQYFGLTTEKEVPALVQEIIQGPDTNHFKYCGYFSKKGRQILGFTLQKIRQQPIRFGVGAAVKSVCFPRLLEIGRNYFEAIGYRGVGSAEFKIDDRDGRLKLIEVNPRYWQQNILADRCGMSFPFVDYLEATCQNPDKLNSFATGVKWINIYSDLDSFLAYRVEGKLTFSAWVRSLKGTKVFSDFALDDIMPAIYEARFWRKMSHIPRYLCRRLIKHYCDAG